MGRHALYLGCKVWATEHDLDRYEQTGEYVAQVKHDGEWAVATILPNGVRFESRTGKTVETVNDTGLKELQGWTFPAALVGSQLVGELEVATQRANDAYAGRGYRTFVVFDVVQVDGVNVRAVALEKRRELLETIWAALDEATRQRFPLVEQRTTGFRAWFDDLIVAGGEGLVLKQYGKPYFSTTQDRKVDHWVKCKRAETWDMVVLDFGYGEKTKEITSFIVGAYRGGRLVPLCNATIQGDLYQNRRNLRIEDWRGKVVEIEGESMFRSGAVRFAFVKRVREDKSPEECVVG